MATPGGIRVKVRNVLCQDARSVPYQSWQTKKNISLWTWTCSHQTNMAEPGRRVLFYHQSVIKNYKKETWNLCLAPELFIPDPEPTSWKVLDPLRIFILLWEFVKARVSVTSMMSLIFSMVMMSTIAWMAVMFMADTLILMMASMTAMFVGIMMALMTGWLWYPWCLWRPW